MSVEKDSFIFRRTYKKEEIYVVCNFEKEQNLSLPKALHKDDYKIVLHNYADRTALNTKFLPYEIAVYAKNIPLSPLQTEDCVIK